MEPGEREAAALRREFDDDYVPGVAQEVTDLVLNALVRDASLFRPRIVPTSELLASVGLSVDEDWVSVTGEDAQPPASLRSHSESRRSPNDSASSAVATKPSSPCSPVGSMKSPNHSSRTSCVRSRELHHGAIGPAFCAYVLEDGDGSSQFLETFALHLASLSGPLAATGHYLLARNFEADDRGLDVRER